MWGTDMTATMTVGEGAAFVFVAVDHCTTECIGLHAAARGKGPGIRQGFGVGSATRDHGSNTKAEALHAAMRKGSKNPHE